MKSLFCNFLTHHQQQHFAKTYFSIISGGGVFSQENWCSGEHMAEKGDQTHNLYLLALATIIIIIIVIKMKMVFLWCNLKRQDGNTKTYISKMMADMRWWLCLCTIQRTSINSTLVLFFFFPVINDVMLSNLLKLTFHQAFQSFLY